MLRYLKRIVDYDLFHKKGDKSNLTSYIDSDFIGDLNNKKSIVEYIFMLGTKTASWSSKK